jgi:hypothetical protein
MDIFAALLSVFCLFAAPHGLADNTANTLCNIYVLISDTLFRRIKGLARIHHHLSITLGIAHHPFIPAFELVASLAPTRCPRAAFFVSCLPPPSPDTYGSSHHGSEPYPAWGAERNIPLSKEEIEDIYLDLQQKFGFQKRLYAEYGAFRILRATPSGACNS